MGASEVTSRGIAISATSAIGTLIKKHHRQLAYWVMTPESTTPSVAARPGADLSNTASVVDRLEAQGLVRKEIHPSDRRARLLTLTDRGEELRKTLDRDVPALAVLDEAERKQLYGLLRRVTTG
ncbi:MarR family winged helix-turn-helix transcriptional regulator [Nocardia gamkensis]|uniref:MarR family winged helix-turn-helix transcriptional regulator n=1 Tax=Nocardia gamkensis TaxID=352869 RepID=UPI0037C8E613